jgi:signal transduction histidine kinase
MHEVSCRVFNIFVKPFAGRKLPLEVLVEGTDVTVKRLRDKHERVDWCDLLVMMKNLRKHFDEDDLAEIGRQYFRAPALRFLFVVARLLFTPLEFYRWANKPRDGAGNQIFTCIVPTQRELSDHELEVDLEVAKGYEVCWDFFLITRGNFEEMPRLLGYPAAHVTLTRLPRGGRFHITVPSRTPFLTRLRRALMYPFAARATAKELKEAHETLVRRYEELEAAHGELAEYKAGLEKLVDERTLELREAQEAREKFFANISHEIRTPLSLILLGAADVQRRAGDTLDDRSQEGLVAVTDSARKLVRLVDELLLLAAGQAHKLELSPEPTDLAALVHHLLGAWRPAAEASGLTLAASVEAQLIAFVDPIAIERVVSNLVSNAIKYTPRGGHVDVELVAGADGLRISVLDTGHGIDDELRGRLFGRFERAHGEDRRKSGTGIGLALVKQLVEAHQGTVEALARPAGGTELRIMLPASVVCTDTAAAAPAALRTTHAPEGRVLVASGMVFAPQGLSQGTVLVAEDEPRLAETLARLLSDRYTVIIALDGKAALELCEQHQPQLLITDVDMPGLDGIELSRRFRDVTNDRLAPIIILSAAIDLRTRLAGLEAGAIDYVTKPFDPNELRARVQAQFRMRELAMRLHRAEQLSTMGILTAGLAHELRNPANGIVNAIPPLLQLLPRELTGPESGTGELLDVMKGCADHIAFLTRQLLGFRNNSELELRPASLAELVQRAIKLAHGALVGVDVRTSFALTGTVRCAPPLLVQVLTNLIENAGHAAGSGGWIEVRAKTAGGTVTVEVADSGPGVPPELRERVFEPFFTTKAPGVGTGLGLSLARNIVHRHGGVLEIRPRGTGSSFVIELRGESNWATSLNAV